MLSYIVTVDNCKIGKIEVHDGGVDEKK